MRDDAAPDACPVSCNAGAPELAELALSRLVPALHAFALTADLGGAVLCVDDLPGCGDGWLRLAPDAAGGKPVLTVYCDRADLEREPTGSVDDGARQDWEQRPAPREDEPWSPDDFDPAAADAFLHHQCALAADVLRGELKPDMVPTGLAEAFAAAWDVVIDGRLARRGMPGYDMAHRRARFSGLFSSASVLLPDHWQIFQSLWEGGLGTQGEVLGAVRRLPRL